MKKIARTAVITLAIMLGAGDIEVGGQQFGLGVFKFVSGAEARIGRPLTPISGAGVARRTTRRVIRRGAYIATIPVGCPYGSYYGYSLNYCGGRYYQRSGGGYVIVYF